MTPNLRARVPKDRPRPAALRLLLVDPRELIRNGLKGVFEDCGRVAVVDVASTGAEAARIARGTVLDVALVALDLPDMDGTEAIRALLDARPSGRLIVVAMADDSRRLVEALKAGARGFVLTGAAGSEIETAVHRALRGELWLGPTAMSGLDAELQAPTRGAGPAPLTAREREVLALVSEGRTNREIAGRLIMAVGTVKVHVEHILGKLDAVDRTEASVRAVQLGLLEQRDRRN